MIYLALSILFAFIGCRLDRIYFRNHGSDLCVVGSLLCLFAAGTTAMIFAQEVF